MKKQKVTGREVDEESKFGARDVVNGVFNSREEKTVKKKTPNNKQRGTRVGE